MMRFQGVVAFCFLMMVPLGFAQSATTDTATPSQHDLSELRVVAQNQYRTTTQESELDRQITVVVKGLQSWMKATGKTPRDLRLYLAGQKLSEESPTLASSEHEYLDFHLEIHPTDRNAWVQILYEARQASDRKIPLSVGYKDTVQVADSDVELALFVYPHYTPYIVALMILLLVVTLVLSIRTDLLRDGTNPPSPPARLPYNLGRVQMAFWFYLVVAAYLYVWLITGEYNTLTNSVLGLIGISAGTGLAAVFVDKQKAGDIVEKRAQLETQISALTARINEITAAAPESGSQLDQELQEKKNKLIEVQAELAHAAPPLPAAISRGFIKDILSSGEGVGFHRFQMAGWTLVLGIIFVRSVYRELTMPEFDTSLLGLMGLSSGTYIGFKFPEKPK